MPDFDLLAFQQEIEKFRDRVEHRINGLRTNLEPWPDLSADETATVQTLAADYEKLRTILQDGREWLTRIVAYGWPPRLPEINVPTSMITTLNREFADAEEVRTLFKGVPPNAKQVDMQPGEEIDKK